MEVLVGSGKKPFAVGQLNGWLTVGFVVTGGATVGATVMITGAFVAV